MKSQFFVPDKIKVGFVKRSDTYNGQLAFVIYYDKKGVLKRETSWENWRSKDIDPLDFVNEPTEGFVLNKNGGGGRGWDSRNEFIRVYDPRGFEFEISLANLLLILQECDSCKGKGLEGKFVYVWSSQKLVLLPVNSQEYQNSIKFTDLKDKKINANKLVVGATYYSKDVKKLVYLGVQTIYCLENKKQLKVWWDLKNNCLIFSNKIVIAEIVDENVSDSLEDYLKCFYESIYGTKPVGLFLKKKIFAKDGNYHILDNNFVYYLKNNKQFKQMRIAHNGEQDIKSQSDLNYNQISCNTQYFIENEIVTSCYVQERYYKEETDLKKQEEKNQHYWNLPMHNLDGWKGRLIQEKDLPNDMDLCVKLESGTEISIYDYKSIYAIEDQAITC